MTHDPAIRAEGIHAAFGRSAVLHGIDLSLRPGTFSLIMGPNGAGKSTLLEILAGAAQPSAGRVIRTGPTALVVQRPAVPTALPLTVADTVAIGVSGPRAASRLRGAARSRAISDALAAVGLTAHAERSLHELSGGQRQRALLAQGLASGAAILFLDEAAAGLDAESRSRTQEILVDRAARGATVCAVSHDPEDRAVADRVIRLDAGRIVADVPRGVCA